MSEILKRNPATGWWEPVPAPAGGWSIDDGTVYVNLQPSVQAQLDRIEARLDRIETMLLAQAHPLNTLTRSNRITGHCGCGWNYEAGGPISSKLRHEIQSHHAAHIYELMHPERTTNADG